MMLRSLTSRGVLKAVGRFPQESLSAGPAVQIYRVCREHPDLFDDAFVFAKLDRWMNRR
jgi:hypothetical protein